MTTYRHDPYWLTTTYAGVDATGRSFAKGTRVWYYPIGKRILTGEQAEQAARDFDAARADEQFMNGGY